MIRNLFVATQVAPANARPEDADPLTQMALAEAADQGLLRLVACAAAATLVLAAAASLTV